MGLNGLIRWRSIKSLVVLAVLSKSPDRDFLNSGKTNLSFEGVLWILQLCFLSAINVKLKLSFNVLCCFSRDRPTNCWVDSCWKWCSWEAALQLLKKSRGSFRLFGSRAPAVLNLRSLPYRHSILSSFYNFAVEERISTNTLLSVDHN